VVRVSGYRSIFARFDSWHYQIFWEVLGLERGLLSLMSTTEGLLGRNNSCSGLGSREYGHGLRPRFVFCFCFVVEFLHV
jgi:hypothetical protein